MFTELMTSSWPDSFSFDHHWCASNRPAVSSPKKWGRNRRLSLRLPGKDERGFWSEWFSFLDNYGRFIRRKKPLPYWLSADVDEFITSDPVRGPILKTTGDATKFRLFGGAIGAVTTAGWKYSKSLHGAGMSFAAGAVFGWTFDQEIVSHWHQLYRPDTMQ